MKILITEDRVDKLKGMIKSIGLLKTSKLMGGFDNLCKVMNIKSPMDLLHLFDDLEQVQSEDEDHLILFRYNKGHNVMIYDKRYECVYIDDADIWSFLATNFNLKDSKFKQWLGFGLKDSKIKGLTTKWLGDVYNLRGVSTEPKLFGDKENGTMRSII
jgi:hypothetical protein